ncbi:CoA transferase [Amycolatopsis sp. K13G38]|uniref:CoA transferase n=1 Tax=Amycolatopsis acididurans TaxID=2724524 RepID=A0ABX1JDI8_9PSEU|nr:CoA transferase [Amycolatopsis acididurans]NKQ56720.1 CoA transferase [Amycolatopsis acididurans]
MSESVLAGLRVVELAEGIPGPFAARLLAEAGAEVVKVERPGGDPARRLWPAGFATWNRGKRGVVLDATRQSALDELLARADVLVHSLPIGQARALGLDEDSLARRHPHLILGTVPAYPEGHPRQDWAASDSLVQAAEGFMDEQQGNRAGPVFIRMPFPSWCAGYLLAAGVLARLVQRERTGTVAAMHTSVFQGALAPAALYWQRAERLPAGLTGHTLPKIWPDAALSIFECGDGEWIQLAGAMGGWLESPPVLETLAVMDKVDLSEIGVTPENRDEWQEVFRQHDSAHWSAEFAEADVPCMRIRDLGDCFSEDQARVNGYVVEVDDTAIGRCLQVGPPIRTSPPSALRSPAPRLGESDLAEVLAAFGDPRPGLARAAARTLPLEGLRALDFGSVVAGPYGAQCLADLGADVVKVEPGSGDRGRGLTQFAGSNRGKRSIALDLKAPEAAEPLRRLIASADIVLHNMRLRAAARLGIDGPGLRAINPRVVFSHVSANGQEGPFAAYPGYDPTAQALTGWERANAGADAGPMWLRNSILDVQAGLAATVGALLQLVQRERTGVVGEAATSLLAAGMTMASEVAVPLDGEPLRVDRIDAGQTGVSPAHRIMPVRDGWVAIAALTEDEQARLYGLTGTASPARAFRDRTVDDLLAELRLAGVPAARVEFDRMDAFFDDPAHRALGMSRSLRTTGYGALDVVGGFWSATPVGESVPALGEHSDEVLRDLGFDSGEITALAERGVVLKHDAEVVAR